MIPRLVVFPNANRKPNTRGPRRGAIEPYLTAIDGVPMAAWSDDDAVDALRGVAGAESPAPPDLEISVVDTRTAGALWRRTYVGAHNLIARLATRFAR